jgi:hypothetical protein
MWCKFVLSRVLREWNGAETHRCTCKKRILKSPQSRKSSNLERKKKVRPNRPKRTEKTEESWEGGGKKIPEKTI